MTAWSDLIAAAMLIIDDVRWRDDLATSPAIFYRAKSDWVKAALPMLNRPPELYRFLTQSMSEPTYASETWVSTVISTTEYTTAVVDMPNYSICSVCIRSADGLTLTPYTGFEYDDENGTVTFEPQTSAGIEYTIDFYADGEFAELTPAQINLFSLAIACVWDQRMDRNWLNLQMKIHDSAFSTASEGTYAEKINQRLMRNVQLFRDALTKYEQDCAYFGRFTTGNSQLKLI